MGIRAKTAGFLKVSKMPCSVLETNTLRKYNHKIIAYNDNDKDMFDCPKCGYKQKISALVCDELHRYGKIYAFCSKCKNYKYKYKYTVCLK